MMETASHCCHGGGKSANEIPPIGRRLAIMGGIFGAVFLVSFLPPLTALNESMLTYLGIVWWAVLIGLFLGGIIDYFVPDGFVVRALGKRSKVTLINAVIAGFLMSACSHGILAIAIQLYKKGASVPAVITFLLASPWANLPMTVLLFGFFGWKGILFVGGAMLIALVTGLVFTVLDQFGWIEGPAKGVETENIRHSGRLANRRVCAGALVHAIPGPGLHGYAGYAAVRYCARSLQRGYLTHRV
jgi:uncharacterized membrane protein YraQ (UPF0718 family)